MTNETIESQLAHRTIRAYKDQPLTEEEVLIAAEAGKAQFSALIRGCLRRLS